jgi:beta-barrel assembly-enhancing protease
MVGCATAPALDSPGARYGADEDERQLIERSEHLEDELRAQGLAYAEPPLYAYLTRMATALMPHETAGGPQFHLLVIRDPTINAFALANGALVVHTGLLAAVYDEPELALVLGHEIAHTNLRHQLNGLRDFQHKTVFAKVATMALAPAAGAFTYGLGAIAVELMFGMTYVAVVNGYSRDHEEAADLAGMRAVAAAGYATERAPELFVHLNEMDDYGVVATFFYGNHPANQSRGAYTRALVADGAVPRNPDGRVGEAELREATRNVVLENIRLRLRARHYGFASAEVDRASQRYGETAQLRYLEGEVHRLRAVDPEGTARENALRAHETYEPEQAEKLARDAPAELDRAQAAYERALALDPALHAARRGLGEIALQRGDPSKARDLLDGYLDADPNAADYRYVERLLKQIQKTAPHQSDKETSP